MPRWGRLGCEREIDGVDDEVIAFCGLEVGIRCGMQNWRDERLSMWCFFLSVNRFLCKTYMGSRALFSGC